MGLKMKDKKTIIFDLDGTLAIIDKRRIKAGSPTGKTPTPSKMDWDVFFDPDNIKLDEPNIPVIKMAQMFDNDGFNIVIFSGRNDRSFDATVEWLLDNKVPWDLLVMRPDKFKDKSWPIAKNNPATPDMRFMPDEILKKKMLDTFVDKDDVLMCVDDRQKVVDMWRENGLTCFQVAPGNF